jgi:tetratricopeptide (TPR) repeat protein
MKLLFTSIFLCFTFVGIAQINNRYTSYVDSLVKIGAEKQLETFFLNELNKFPKDDTVISYLAFYYLAISDTAKASYYIAEGLKINPKSARCHFYKGDVYFFKGETNKTLLWYEKGFALNNNYGPAYNQRAKYYQYLGKNYEALADFKKAISLEPNNAMYYLDKGIFNASQQFNLLALADFDKVISLVPDYPDAYFYRANTLFTLGKHEESLTAINQAIQLDSINTNFFAGRATLYTAIGEYDLSIADYNKAIEISPQNYTAFYYRGDAYYKLEDMNAACTNFNICLGLLQSNNLPQDDFYKMVEFQVNNVCDSNKASYYYQRGIAQYNLGNHTLAIKQYEAGLKKFPTNGLTLQFAGNAYMALGDYANALVYYTKALANAENWKKEIAGNANFINSNEAELEKYFKTTIATTYQSTAECRLYLNELEKALEDINYSISQMPENNGVFDIAILYHTKGVIYLYNNQFQNAINEFNTAIKMNPDFEPAYTFRAIAKVSLFEKNQNAVTTITLNANTQKGDFGWTFPKKSSIKSSDSVLTEAIADCEKTISINPDYAFAFYIKEQPVIPIIVWTF